MRASRGEQVEKLPDRDIGDVEAGSIRVEFVRLTSIQSLEQVRQKYHREHIKNLADRIPVVDEGDKVYFDLQHPVTIACFDNAVQLEAFLREHAKFYEYEYDPSIIDGLPYDGAVWQIQVSGHQRARALELKALEEGIDPERVLVSSSILDNPIFDAARKKQYIENTYSSPHPKDDALAMKREYVYRWGYTLTDLRDRKTELARIKEIADYMCFSLEKVEEGLLYASMPEEITDYEKKGLSYGNIANLARIRKLYSEQRNEDESYKYDYAEAYQRTLDYFNINILSRLRGTPRGDITRAINNEVERLKGESRFIIDSLLEGMFSPEDEVAIREAARQKVGKEITDAAFNALRQGLGSKNPKLRDHIVESLRGLMATVEGLGESEQPDEDNLFDTEGIEEFLQPAAH